MVRGARTSRGGPHISYLLFADDCILFEKAMVQGVLILKEILSEYERSSR